MRPLASMECLAPDRLPQRYVRAAARHQESSVLSRPVKIEQTWLANVFLWVSILLSSGFVLTISVMAIWWVYLELVRYSSLNLIRAITGA